MKKNAGFTLIELIAVMVILAIIAVIAIPQFTDLRVDAANASAAGVGGAIASGTAINYAKGITSPGNNAVKSITGCVADELATVLVGATADDQANTITVGGRTYTIANQATTVNTGETAACTIQDTSISGTAAQTFHIVGCAGGGVCAP